MRSFISLTLVASVCLAGCGSKLAVPAGVSAVKVELLAPAGGRKTLSVDRNAALHCLRESKRIELEQVIKEALQEGKYEITLLHPQGATQLILFNSRNLSDEQDHYYENRCLYKLVAPPKGP